MKDLGYKIKRLLGYVLGFLLFYEPFMLFQKLADSIFPQIGFQTLHVPCARIPLAGLLTGNWLNTGITSLVFCALLILITLWLGPVFCGRLCPAGAFSEYLSSILPDKYKIDWPKLIPIIPVRYGFLIGYMSVAFMGINNPCAYCNYCSLEIFINFLVTGHILNLLPSLFITFLSVNVILGIFTKGGRGYCMFLCPIGAFSSILNIIGKRLPYSQRLRIDKLSCINCGLCSRQCPMRAIIQVSGKPTIQQQLCINCGQCSHTCPKRAIKYTFSQEDK